MDADFNQQNPSTILAYELGSAFPLTWTRDVNSDSQPPQSTIFTNSTQTLDEYERSGTTATTAGSEETSFGHAVPAVPDLKLTDWESIYRLSTRIRDVHLPARPGGWFDWKAYRRDLKTLLSQDIFKRTQTLNPCEILKERTKNLHRGCVKDLLKRRHIPSPRLPLIDALCGLSEDPTDVDPWEVRFLTSAGEVVHVGRYNQVEGYFWETIETFNSADVQLPELGREPLTPLKPARDEA